MAFYAEIVETTVLIIASAVLSFTILDPATTIFVPLYLVGSILAVFSTYRRGSSAIVLCTWFTIMNSWAFIQLFIL
jgi:trehalose utilization protein